MAALDSGLRRDGSMAIVQPQAISGLGGIGKTRLALEYAWSHESEFTALLFVSAYSPVELETSLARLSGPDVLALSENKLGNPDEQVAAVIRWLQQNKGWLLVLDSVDTPEAAAAAQKLVALLSGGRVLITSRLTQWSGGTRVLSLDVIPADDAVSFLLEFTKGRRAARPDEGRQAEALSERLGYLPLALTHAAAYIGYYGIGFGDYLAEFERNLASVLSYHDHNVIEYETEPEKAGMVKTVATTFFISFDRLGPVEKSILRAASFLAPVPIPLMVFESPEEMETLVKIWCEESGEQPVDKPIRDALAELARFSLVTRGDGSFSVHRMVQAVQHYRLDKAGVVLWMECAVRLVNESFPSPEFSSWLTCERLIAHARSCAGFIERLGFRSLEAARLLNDSGCYFQFTARYAEAEPLMRRALAIDEQSFGPDHPKVAISLNNLAALLQVTNRLTDAEPLMRRALAIDEQSFGPDHPKVAISLNNLAALLQVTNRLTEAEPLMRRALAIDELSFGPDHPKVAIRLNNLAQLLQDTNRLTDAEPLMRRALAIDEQSFGPDHPEVATDLNNLAHLLQDTNRPTETEPLMRRAVAIDEQSFGPDHPNVAIRLNNLAQLLQDTNRLTEAEPLMRRVAEIFEKSLGADHPNVAVAINNLAHLLKDTNRLTEAEPLMRRVVEIRRQFTIANGHQHPRLQAAIENYVGLLGQMGRSWEEIKALLDGIEIPGDVQTESENLGHNGVRPWWKFWK